jgi:hypothetical protein
VINGWGSHCGNWVPEGEKSLGWIGLGWVGLGWVGEKVTRKKGRWAMGMVPDGKYEIKEEREEGWMGRRKDGQKDETYNFIPRLFESNLAEVRLWILSPRLSS